MDAQQWVDISQEAVERDPHGQLLKYFVLQAIEDLDDRLAQRVVPGQIDEITFNAVRATMATKSRGGMGKVANAVLLHLESGGGIQANDLIFMLKILRYSRLAGLLGSDQHERLATRGHFLHFLYQAVSEGNAKAVGECMFAHLEVLPDASHPDQFGNSHAGQQNLAQILEDPDFLPGVVERFEVLATETNDLSTVLAITTGKQPVPAFAAKVLRALLAARSVSKAPELVRKYWSVIREVLEPDEEDSQDFVKFLKGLPEIETLVSQVTDGDFDVTDCGLYLALLRGESSSVFETWCARGISSADESAWSDEIIVQGPLVGLGIELNARGVSMAPSPAYYDALSKYAKGLSQGVKTLLPKDMWHALFNLLDADQQELFPRRVYEILGMKWSACSDD